MKYNAALDFFMQYFKNSHIPCKIYDYPAVPESVQDFDLGLRRLLKPDINYTESADQLMSSCESNTIYRIYDEFWCQYMIFQIPDPDADRFLVIGPFTLTPLPSETLLNHIESFSLPPEIFSQLKNYYQNLPVISDENTILLLVSTLGEQIWGGMDHFSIQNVHNSVILDLEPVAERSESQKSEDAFLSMKILEERYNMENQFMQAVSQGQLHKAELFLNDFSITHFEQRMADRLRNAKNYLIILNTLLRKAAEAGAVHPLHIDSLSSKFARKIELITSENASETLRQEMVHKYCLLVRNHSMKGYSLLVQKVLARIDSDLTADLSLKTQAALLEVNPSYLSTLFKKETGSTLTEYVNRKRVEYGIFLLNSTNMQIQTVAQHCGMPDVNYFTKVFKKIVGKPPKEYRESIGRPSSIH